MRNHKEDDLQAACIKWIRYAYPDIVCFSIPNGGKRNAIEAARMKHTGTLPGVADLFVMKSKEEPSSFNPERYIHIWHGLFIEMKVGKNTQSECQSDFAAAAMAGGYKYSICRSFDEFKTVIEKYLGNDKGYTPKPLPVNPNEIKGNVVMEKEDNP